MNQEFKPKDSLAFSQTFLTKSQYYDQIEYKNQLDEKDIKIDQAKLKGKQYNLEKYLAQEDDDEEYYDFNKSCINNKSFNEYLQEQNIDKVFIQKNQNIDKLIKENLKKYKNKLKLEKQKKDEEGKNKDEKYDKHVEKLREEHKQLKLNKRSHSFKWGQNQQIEQQKVPEKKIKTRNKTRDIIQEVFKDRKKSVKKIQEVIKEEKKKIDQEQEQLKKLQREQVAKQKIQEQKDKIKNQEKQQKQKLDNLHRKCLDIAKKTKKKPFDHQQIENEDKKYDKPIDDNQLQKSLSNFDSLIQKHQNDQVKIIEFVKDNEKPIQKQDINEKPIQKQESIQQQIEQEIQFSDDKISQLMIQFQNQIKKKLKQFQTNNKQDLLQQQEYYKLTNQLQNNLYNIIQNELNQQQTLDLQSSIQNQIQESVEILKNDKNLKYLTNIQSIQVIKKDEVLPNLSQESFNSLEKQINYYELKDYECKSSIQDLLDAYKNTSNDNIFTMNYNQIVKKDKLII